MSNDSWPIVRVDQRIIPEDFNRLSDRVEDVLARWVARFMLNPNLASYSEGVVLHGFDVNQIGLPATQIRITAGVALVPWGPPKDADRNNAGDGMSASWRIVSTTGDTIVNLDLPAPGPRNDFIMIDRQYVDEQVEAREFRIEGNPDDQVQNDNVATFRKPQGAVVQDTAYQAGTVKIVELQLTDAGVQVITDRRTFAWAVDADSPINIGPVGGASYAHGLRSMLNDLYTRIPKVIHPDGLAAAVEVAEGGPDLLFDFSIALGDYMDTNGRNIVSSSTIFQRYISIGNPTDPSYFEDVVGTEGRVRNGANFARAQALVRLTKDAQNDVSDAGWVGNGIQGVTRVDDETWDVQFHANLFDAGTAGFGGFIDKGRWLVKAGPHYDIPGYLDEPDAGAHTQAKLCTVHAQAADTIRVRCFIDEDTGGVWAASGFSFWIQLFGPFQPTLGDEPGAVWNAIAI